MTGPLFFTVLCLVAVISLGLFLGSAPERWIAGLLLIDQIIDLLYFSTTGTAEAFATVSLWLFLWDLAIAAVLIAICIRANRVWVFPFCSAQIVIVIGHISAFAWHDGMQRAYWSMTQLPLGLQLVALLAGVARHVSRYRRHGPYRSWRGAAVPTQRS